MILSKLPMLTDEVIRDSIVTPKRLIIPTKMRHSDVDKSLSCDAYNDLKTDDGKLYHSLQRPTPKFKSVAELMIRRGR